MKEECLGPDDKDGLRELAPAMGLVGGGTELTLISLTMSLGSDLPPGFPKKRNRGLERPVSSLGRFWSLHTLFPLLTDLLCILSLKDSWNK